MVTDNMVVGQPPDDVDLRHSTGLRLQRMLAEPNGLRVRSTVKVIDAMVRTEFLDVAEATRHLRVGVDFEGRPRRHEFLEAGDFTIRAIERSVERFPRLIGEHEHPAVS